MIVDAAIPPSTLNKIPSIAKAAEQIGFKCLWISETIHDPLLPGALIAEHTQRIHFGTSIAVSFARSPATLAYTAWDLSQASRGRFILGLGTQVKAHIVRRFGMDWPDSVTGKLREQIAAIRAFWNCWQTGEAFNFRGEYYRLNLMTPFFNPGPIEYPKIPIYIAGVNPGLARLAGEVADGFMVHPFHSTAYLSEIILPAIEQGAHKSGRKPADVCISGTVFAVLSTEELAFVRAQLAFYASTPSYRAVMRFHGWEQNAEKLSALAAQGRWGEMPELITDDMLEVFATIAPVDHLAISLRDRYQQLVNRLSLYLPFQPGERDNFWNEFVYTLG